MDLDDDELRATRKLFFGHRKINYIAIPEKEMKHLNEQYIKLKKENKILKEKINQLNTIIKMNER